MTSLASAKAAGRKWETACADWLSLWFKGTERRRLKGAKDWGDLIPGVGLEDWTIECKAERRIQLAGALDEAEQESINANTPWYVVLQKRRQKPTSSGYAVMPIWVWGEVVRRLHELSSTPPHQ